MERDELESQNIVTEILQKISDATSQQLQKLTAMIVLDYAVGSYLLNYSCSDL